MLGTLNNWNTIKFTNKNTSKEDFDDIHNFVLDGISDNTELLVHTVKYGSISTTHPTVMGYYVTIFLYYTVKLW